MGVRINGVWHEELADPESGGTDTGAGRNFESPQQYAAAAGSASQQGGQNLNWGGGTGNAAAAPTASTGTSAADAYARLIQQSTDALAAGNREAFQRAVYEFDQTFGLDKEKVAISVDQFNRTFGITQAGMTGQYQGAPTLPALTSYANQFGQWGVPQTGAQTLAAQQQQYAQQMGMISQAATLQANPFRQQQAIGQMSNLLGGQGVAGFSAPNTVAGVGTVGGNTQGGLGYLQTMIDDIRNPTANQTSMNQVLQGIPTPNQLNSVEFNRAAPSTQSMVLQGMQEKYGLDPADSLKQIQATLPAFQAPTLTGSVRR